MRARLILPLLCLCASLPARAQWKQVNAPSGILITGVASDGLSAVYAGSGAQVYRSVDQGDAWLPLPEIPGAAPIDRLWSPLAADAGGVYAGFDNGLFRLDNGAAAWIRLTAGLTDSSILCLHRDGGALYAGTRSGAIFRSTDRGGLWARLNGPLDPDGSTAGGILSLSAAGDTLYAGTRGGLFLSGDGGDHWKPIHAGLKDSVVLSLARNNASVFARTDSGLYRTRDAGAHWTRIDPASKASRYTALDAFGPRLLATTSDALYRSLDDGATWKADSVKFETSAHSFTRMLSCGGDLFASTYFGMSRSRDSGSTWSPINTGMARSVFHDLIPLKNGDLLAATDMGLFRSADSGRSWIRAARIGPGTGYLVYNFFVHGDLLFAGTIGGMFRSKDQGSSWQRINTGFPGAHAGSYVALANALFASGEDYGAFRSLDNGDSWTQIGIGLPSQNHSITGMAVCDGIVFAGAGGNAYSFSPFDSMWSMTSMDASYKVNAIAGMGPYLLMGSQTEGVVRSANEGTTWKNTSAGLQDTAVMSFHLDGGNLWAGTGKGPALSTDSGLTWNPYNSGLPEKPVTSFLARKGDLFVGIGSDGLWMRSRAEDPTGALAPRQRSRAAAAKASGKKAFRKLGENGTLEFPDPLHPGSRGYDGLGKSLEVR